MVSLLLGCLPPSLNDLTFTQSLHRLLHSLIHSREWTSCLFLITVFIPALIGRFRCPSLARPSLLCTKSCPPPLQPGRSSNPSSLLVRPADRGWKLESHWSPSHRHLRTSDIRASLGAGLMQCVRRSLRTGSLRLVLYKRPLLFNFLQQSRSLTRQPITRLPS